MGKHLADDDFVLISSQTGEPISNYILRGKFKRIIVRAGCKPISIHVLRLISQQIPVKVIADRLGNTPEMILNIYGLSFKN